MEYLPAVVAVLGVAITAYVNWRLGQLKSTTDIKASGAAESDALRDDLLQLTNFYEARDNRLSTALDKAQARISELLDQIDQLRVDNRLCAYELKNTQAELQKAKDELAKFDKKVFYRPEGHQGEQ